MNTFVSGYTPLFEVQILHRYFLNVGQTRFDDAPDAPDVLATRRAYDVRRFWRIEPDAATADALRNYGMELRLTAEGFRVALATSPAQAEVYGMFAGLPPQLRLRFHVFPVDPQFMLYTWVDPKIMHYLAGYGGQVYFSWTNDKGRSQLNDSESLEPLEEQPLEGISTPPLGIISLSHDPKREQYLWNDSGYGLNQRFTAVLNNRETIWVRPDADTARMPLKDIIWNAKQLGRYPLTRYGFVHTEHEERGEVLPRPSLATTYQLESEFYSLIS